MGRLILLCGLPGSGKTTLARRLADELPAVRLCPDEWLTGLDIDLFETEARDRMEDLLRQHAYHLLALGQKVILEFGFWARAEREELRLRARALGAAVELIYLDVPLAELWRRVEARGREGGAPISKRSLERWAQAFQAPDPSELALFDEPLRR
ncbi:AAA family ATPase [Nonomuraea sp. NPDC050536]|uniref:AAA family ATPase n=1 Tax=Nonomuraea sp. NPDC050536 TaxID=3364366 RepID=UPI0037C7B5A6